MDPARREQPHRAPVQVELSQDGDRARVAVTGELDMSTADELAEAQDRGVRVVAVNCRPSVARVLEITGVDRLLAG